MEFIYNPVVKIAEERVRTQGEPGPEIEIEKCGVAVVINI